MFIGGVEVTCWPNLPLGKTPNESIQTSNPFRICSYPSGGRMLSLLHGRSYA